MVPRELSSVGYVRPQNVPRLVHHEGVTQAKRLLQHAQMVLPCSFWEILWRRAVEWMPRSWIFWPLSSIMEIVGYLYAVIVFETRESFRH